MTMARCKTEKRHEKCHEPRKSKCDRRKEHRGDDKGKKCRSKNPWGGHHGGGGRRD
jgi:hypothetical protein